MYTNRRILVVYLTFLVVRKHFVCFEYFKNKHFHINLKYIDPGYQIRAAVTTANDSIYCERLGNNTVHAAMAGKTKMVVGLVHDKFVHIPISEVTCHRNVVDTEGALWRDTLEATDQPILIVAA